MENHYQPSASAQTDVPTPEELWHILRETAAERQKFQRAADQRMQKIDQCLEKINQSIKAADRQMQGTDRRIEKIIQNIEARSIVQGSLFPQNRNAEARCSQINIAA